MNNYQFPQLKIEKLHIHRCILALNISIQAKLFQVLDNLIYIWDTWIHVLSTVSQVFPVTKRKDVFQQGGWTDSDLKSSFPDKRARKMLGTAIRTAPRPAGHAPPRPAPPLAMEAAARQ